MHRRPSWPISFRRGPGAGRLLAASVAALTSLGALLALPVAASADTVMVVGVIVNERNDRVGGALIRLYTTSTRMGRPLAEDRSSIRGVFSLVRTNIAGDLGDLYVVYEGETGTAEPIKVSLKPGEGGMSQARTADMVVLMVTERGLSNDEAAKRIAAFGQTQAILVQAGVRDPKTATEAVQLRTRQVVAAAPNLNARDAAVIERSVNDKLKSVSPNFRIEKILPKQ